MATGSVIEGTSLRVPPDQFPDPAVDLPAPSAGEPAQRSIVLAGGCFWCTEAVYRQMDGVLDVVPGYAGGAEETADYESVCTGRTGHAEAIRITYDPSRVSLGQILKVFFSVAHDPTQLNRQGNDVGTQYRSAIFPADPGQERVAAAYMRQLSEAGVFTGPIATTLEPLDAFYEAEAYHRDYAAQHPNQPYIAYTSMPKVRKFAKYFPQKVKGQE
jgi:peptide-methionine (S)-S-oxide reductase